VDVGNIHVLPDRIVCSAAGDEQVDQHAPDAQIHGASLATRVSSLTACPFSLFHVV
jgi:hypothetical protein